MADKKSLSAIGGMMVVGLGVGGAMLENIPVYTACRTGLGILAGALIDQLRKRNNDSDLTRLQIGGRPAENLKKAISTALT